MTRAGWHWPLALAGLLAGGIIFDLVFLVVASRDPTFSVERDYYRKALDWDRTMAQEGHNAALGWRAAAALARDGAGRSRLGVTLTDRAGAPLTGAVVSAEMFHNARAAQVLEARLAEEAAGAYAASVPAARPGLWEVRITVARGGDVFTRTLETELGRAP